MSSARHGGSSQAFSGGPAFNGDRRWSSARLPDLVRAGDRWLLGLIQRRLAGASIRYVLWDGTELPSSVTPVATLEIKDRATLAGLVWNPDLAFGEAYSAGRVEVHGSLIALLEAVYRVIPSESREARIRRFLALQGNSPARSRDNIHHHYDLGNDFYRLWLDERMVYTCAYFPTPDTDLEVAQIAKMDLVCRKLDLRPGERVVEAGCGWGALALHMARHYGVSVRAFNISSEQIRYARERAARLGLSARVEFVEEDYRAIRGTFDAFVSVGMLEHVGPDNYAALADVIHDCLDRAGGRGLLHFIGRNRPSALNAWIRKRIFPGAYPPTLAQVMERVLEPRGFSILDVENLRLHYARTLDHWLQRYEEQTERVRAMFDEPFVRAWRLYLAGSQASFSSGALQLFQITFTRPRNNSVPWTRAALYVDSGGAASHRKEDRATV